LAILALGDLREAIGLTSLSEPVIVLGTTLLALLLMIVGSLLWPDRKVAKKTPLDLGGAR
jgi:hypothetical protein